MLQVAPPTLGLQKANEKPKKETPNDLGAEVFATPKSLKSQETEKVFAAERARNLALLSGLFGNKDVWEGREDSAGDKVESGEYDEEGDIALGPTRQGREPMPAETSAPVIAEERILPPHSPLVSSNDQPDESASISEAQTEVKRLKDLFAPAAEPAPFSLLAGLDLDLDDEFDFGPLQATQPHQLPATQPISQGILDQVTRGSREQKRSALLDGLDFSARVPYFFPFDSNDRPRGAANATKDIFAIADSRGWNDFWKEPPPLDEVKAGWMNSKVELTRDWKQRYRDAQKKRRRGGVGTGTGGRNGLR